MGNVQALRHMRDELHISPSAVTLWLGCSMLYYFRYVADLPPETTSVAPVFGSALHRSLEAALQEWKHTGRWPALDTVTDVFQGDFRNRMRRIEIPIVFKKDLPTEADALQMGKHLLDVFLTSAPSTFSGLSLVETELPLSVPLADENGEATDLKLVGVIDALVRTDRGNLAVIDFKTAARDYADDDVSTNEQLSAYAYLIEKSGWISDATPVSCQLHVFLKQKEPKIRIHLTLRNAAQRARFAKTALAVGRAIANRVFVPSRSYRCPTCEYARACATC